MPNPMPNAWVHHTQASKMMSLLEWQERLERQARATAHTACRIFILDLLKLPSFPAHDRLPFPNTP